MNSPENAPHGNSGYFTQPVPPRSAAASLSEITESLAAPQTGNADHGKPQSPDATRPEVVFLNADEADQLQNGGQQIVELQLHTASQNREAAGKAFPNSEVDQFPLVELQPSSQRFAVDPFAQEVDGPMPVMPTLPVVESEQITQRVLDRESSGDHYAWTLLDTPYPAEGNTESGTTARSNDSTTGRDVTEVTCEGDQDCFIAHPGQVIDIDGNQGFDHIDLRSYSIDDATFQPGTILLHTNVNPDEMAEGEQMPPPITIRHRGVDFAVFQDEVRVDL